MNDTIHKYSPPVIASSIPARVQQPYGSSPYADERADTSMSSSPSPYTPSELKQSNVCQETLKQSGYHNRAQLFGRISSIDLLLSSVNVSRDGSLTRTRTNTKQVSAIRLVSAFGIILAEVPAPACTRGSRLPLETDER
jgi:hypothetical protein